MVNVKSVSSVWYVATCVARNGNNASQVIVVNLYVVIIFERQLDGKIDFNGIVVNAAISHLPALNTKMGFDGVRAIGNFVIPKLRV